MVVAAHGDLAVQNVLGQLVRAYGVAHAVARGLGLLAVRLFAGLRLVVFRRSLVVRLGAVGAVGGIGRFGNHCVAGLLSIRADRFRLQCENQHERRGDHNGCAADNPRQGRFFLPRLFCVQRLLRFGVFAGDGKGNFRAVLHVGLLRRQIGVVVHVCHCLPYCWCPLSIPHAHAVCNLDSAVQIETIFEFLRGVSLTSTEKMGTL